MFQRRPPATQHATATGRLRETSGELMAKAVSTGSADATADGVDDASAEAARCIPSANNCMTSRSAVPMSILHGTCGSTAHAIHSHKKYNVGSSPGHLLGPKADLLGHRCALHRRERGNVF